MKADFGDQALTQNNLQGTTLSSLVDVTASGAFAAEFEAEFEIGDFSGSETFLWQDSSVFDGSQELPELSETGDLIRMTRIDQEDLRGFFNQIGTKLEELLESLDAGDAPEFGNDFLPWLKQLKLPELSGLSDRIRELVDDGLSDEEGRADFGSLQELRERLATLTQRETLLSYLPDTAELSYEFEVSASRELSVDLASDADYGSLAGIELNGSAAASGDFLLSGVFGVDLTELAEDTTPGDISDDDSWANHFFLEDLAVTADLAVETDSASAAARLGFVGLTVGEVGVATNAAAAIALADPDAPDGRITFKRLSELVVSDPAALIESSSLSGSAELSLSQMSASGIPGLELDGGVITVGLSDLSNPASFNLEVNEALRNINALSSVTIDQWVDLAGDVIDLIDTLTEGGKWDQELPGIGVSANSLIDHAARLQQAIDSLLNTDEATIQELGESLELALEDALQLPPELLEVLLNWQDNTLQMTVDLQLQEQATLPLSLDLATLISASSDDASAFDLVEDLVDVGGQTSIEVAALLEANLVFGVSVEEVLAGSATVPELFVGDSTGLSAELEIAAEDLEASIVLGPLGVFIRDGKITLDEDGDASTSSPASLSVGLVEVADEQYSLEEIQALTTSDIETSFDAGASIVLPLYFPTESDPVGGSEVDDANAIIVGVGNIAGMFNEEDPAITLQAPDLNSLIEDFDPVDEGLRVLADGLDALLARVEELLREQVLNQDLPMVGDKLEEAADFLQDVRENALPILRNDLSPNQLVDDVKQVLFDALGAVMQLVDSNGDGRIDHEDIDLLLDSVTQEAKLGLMLGGSYEVGSGIDFDLGLPGIGLALEGAVAVTLDWALDVGIGIDRDNGFYVDTTDVNELELGVLVEVPDSELTGTLGLFQVTARDSGSALQAQFDVDLKEPSGDGLLTFSELISGSVTPGQLVEATLT
ncbi:MAG: hypothetical protein AAF394_09090, partial [Planctomycetota bacterium]